MGSTKTAGPDNDGPLKSGGRVKKLKMQDRKLRDQIATREIYVDVIAGHEKQDNVRCKICKACRRPGNTV